MYKRTSLIVLMLMIVLSAILGQGGPTLAQTATPPPASGSAMPTLIDPGGHIFDITDVTFPPDDKTILTSSDDSTARLWDIRTEKSIRVFFGHKNVLTSVAVSPDGKIAATTSFDDTLRLWNVGTGQLLHTFPLKHYSYARSAVFSPDGKLVAAGSDDGLWVWEVATGQALPINSEHYPMPIAGLAFSPNGQTIAVARGGGADTVAELLDARTGRTLATYTGHTGTLTSIAFSPNGLFLRRVVGTELHVSGT